MFLFLYQNAAISGINIKGLFGYIDFSVSLDKSNVIAIYAPNGYGKTTAFRALKYIYSRNYRDLARIHFERIEIKTLEGKILHVEKEQPDYRGSKIFISIDGQNRVGVTPDDTETQDDVINRIVRTELPWLRRRGIRTWVDSRTGKTLSQRELVEQYGEKILNSKPNDVNLSEDISTILSATTVRIIESQRLVEKHEERSDVRIDRSGIQMVDTVARFANDLKQKMGKVSADYTKTSQELDNSFPRRLLELDTEYQETEDIIKKFDEIEEKRRKLVSLGLLSDDAVSNIQPYLNNETIENNRATLSIYLEDMQKKLEVFDNISKKLQMFSEIINTKFLNKIIKFSEDTGFIFESSYNKSPLYATELSSGEQHELVLCYQMLFLTGTRTLLLIDEPEISLHVSWQHRFMDDLLAMQKMTGFQAIVATHSPQVLRNHWDIAHDLMSEEDDGRSR